MTTVPRYQPGPAAAVDLSDNTNLWGTPPAAQAALAREAGASVSRYPSAYGDQFKEAAAGYAGVSADQVITGCGSDDVIEVAIRMGSQPGGRIAFSSPTFSMIPAFGQLSHLECVPVPFRADWDIDVDRLLDAGADITYLCSPNNPTATGISRGALEAVVTGAKGLVIVDEAYFEYSGLTAAGLVRRSDRLLVTRTLSKAFGLAGLRAGYGIGAPSLIQRLETARGPFKVSSVSEVVAAAALREDRTWVAERVDETLALRERFRAAVAAGTGWLTLPSRANFVLAVPADRSQDSAIQLDARLRAAGIAGRLLRALPGIGDAIRITIGPWPLLSPIPGIMAAEARP